MTEAILSNVPESVQCMLIPCSPSSIILPAACVAEVISDPDLIAPAAASPSWMKGYNMWRNNRIPVISYESLHSNVLVENTQKPKLVVLNPISGAIRKAYTGLLCYGSVSPILVDAAAIKADLPDGMDKRYISMSVSIDNDISINPDLKPLSVVFSYS